MTATLPSIRLTCEGFRWMASQRGSRTVEAPIRKERRNAAPGRRVRPDEDSVNVRVTRNVPDGVAPYVWLCVLVGTPNVVLLRPRGGRARNPSSLTAEDGVGRGRRRLPCWSGRRCSSGDRNVDVDVQAKLCEGRDQRGQVDDCWCLRLGFRGLAPGRGPTPGGHGRPPGNLSPNLQMEYDTNYNII